MEVCTNDLLHRCWTQEFQLRVLDTNRWCPTELNEGKQAFSTHQLVIVEEKKRPSGSSLPRCALRASGSLPGCTSNMVTALLFLVLARVHVSCEPKSLWLYLPIGSGAQEA